MSIPRRLGIGSGFTPDSNPQTINPSSRTFLQYKLGDASSESLSCVDGTTSSSGEGPNSPLSSHSSSSPGRFNSNLYSPKPSPGLRVPVASPAPSAAGPAPASYSVLPALDRMHRYVITGTLQQSLFGVVKLAFDRQLKTQVAIKISRRERSQQQQTRSGVRVLENVKREAAVLRYMYERSSMNGASTSSTTNDFNNLSLNGAADEPRGSGKKVKLSSRALQHVKAVEEGRRKNNNTPNNGMEDAETTTSKKEITANGINTGTGNSIESDTDPSSDSEEDARMISPSPPANGDDLDSEAENYICRFIDEMEDEYFHYLITEFVPAGDLYSMLTSFPEHRLIESQARGLFRQMVLGMKWLHDRNIAHLDMSLENMCMGSDDTLRIIDFGVAAIHPFTPTTYASATAYFNFPSVSTPLSSVRSVPSTSPSHRSFICKPIKELYAKPGKLRYMSPELFQGLAWDAFAHDVFSLGVILYSLLTGRPPFQQAESNDVWFHVIYSGQWLTPQIKKQPSAHVYTHLSESSLDLVNRILKPQEIRPTCEQILEHPWMQMQN